MATRHTAIMDRAVCKLQKCADNGQCGVDFHNSARSMPCHVAAWVGASGVGVELYRHDPFRSVSLATTWPRPRTLQSHRIVDSDLSNRFIKIHGLSSIISRG